MCIDVYRKLEGGMQTEPSEIERLRSLLYEAIVELSYVQAVENCRSGLCASAKGAALVEVGMKLLGVKDLSSETWEGTQSIRGGE
jgi:hypothetical protein